MKKFLLGALVLALLAGAGWFAAREGFISIPWAETRQPSLTREVQFAEEISESVRERIRGHVTLDRTQIQKDPNDIDAWLDLAIQYREARDFKGAEQVWKYLSEKFPTQHTSAFNLGVLYHQDLKKYSRAEEQYNEAIRRFPTDPLNYLGLHELYRYSYKQDTTAAVDILIAGMEAVPDDANMPIALAAYYRDDKKDYPASIEYIHKAIDVLKENAGSPDKIKALEGEAERLGKLQ